MNKQTLESSALVIGASRGIGLELVKQYLAAGCSVVASARDDAGIERLKALGAKAIRIDVADAASAAGLAQQIDGHKFDVIFVNAGVYGPELAGLQPPQDEDFDHVMHTNVLGPMRVLPQLAESLAPGARIGVLSSRMGSIGSRTSASAWLYRASKAAVNSVTRDASIVLGSKATIVALHPGWVRTDMGGSGADLSIEQSAGDLRKLLAGLKPEQNGHYLSHDGTAIAW